VGRALCAAAVEEWHGHGEGGAIVGSGMTSGVKGVGANPSPGYIWIAGSPLEPSQVDRALEVAAAGDLLMLAGLSLLSMRHCLTVDLRGSVIGHGPVERVKGDVEGTGIGTGSIGEETPL